MFCITEVYLKDMTNTFVFQYCTWMWFIWAFALPVKAWRQRQGGKKGFMKLKGLLTDGSNNNVSAGCMEWKSFSERCDEMKVSSNKWIQWEDFSTMWFNADIFNIFLRDVQSGRVLVGNGKVVVIAIMKWKGFGQIIERCCEVRG